MHSCCQRSRTTYRSTSDDLKKKKGHDTAVKGQGKAITPCQNSVIKCHQFRSVVVDSSPAVADLLQSASEVIEAEREL